MGLICELKKNILKEIRNNPGYLYKNIEISISTIHNKNNIIIFEAVVYTDNFDSGIKNYYMYIYENENLNEYFWGFNNNEEKNEDCFFLHTANKLKNDLKKILTKKEYLSYFDSNKYEWQDNDYDSNEY